MSSHQPALFIEGNRHFHFLELTLREGVEAAALRSCWKKAQTEIAGLPGDYLVAFGPAAWRGLAPSAAVPEDLRDFSKIDGPGGRAPTTQRDLLLHVTAAERDHAFALARALGVALAPVALIEVDVAGFVYLDSRDLTGFVDGSANPKDDERSEVALIPAGQAGAGGSHVLTQRWVHDLAKWNGLPVAEQEQIIGRTKADSIELEGEALRADSHVARMDVKRDGVAQKLYRKSAPYGSMSEAGLYFIAFCRDPSRFEFLLERMYGASDDELPDRLTGFSQAVSGSYWFAPSLEDLKSALSS